MLDPLGKPEDEITAPKPRVSSGSSSKQKATLSKTSATSKHRAQPDRHHDAVMEGIKQLQDQQLASLSSLGTAVHSMVSTVKEFMQFFARAGSQKRKRGELSGSDVDEYKGDDAIPDKNIAITILKLCLNLKVQDCNQHIKKIKSLEYEGK